MKLSGWGRFPTVDSERLPYRKAKNMATHLRENSQLIPRGNGRSYGDPALAQCHLAMKPMNRLLDFDPESGVLTCETGVLLSDIIETFLPRGWFPMVTPGTKYITVGGAIASDIHGKNHHIDGCFSECLRQFKLLMPDGQVHLCSRDRNAELFHATCGGMGLTGVMLEATIQLKRVTSQWIQQTTIKTGSLEETFQAFETRADVPYSVAWIDTLAEGLEMGRSVLTVGDFAADGDLDYRRPSSLNVPFNFPGFLLNKTSMRLFNKLYYRKAPDGVSDQKVGINSFFYPLDILGNWNRIYGNDGFVQYQFILPKKHSFEGLTKILSRISGSDYGSFLAVLKLYGPANDNYLSFPMEGYSLALDFKMQPGLTEFLHELGEIVIRYDGRIYLAKDAVMTRQTFEQGYPQLDKFKAVRQRYNLDQTFNSHQSERLGL